MIKEGVVIGGRYQIVGRVGTGGMADVYKAMDLKLNRYVAVKVLKREFREDELFVKKFQTEAQSAAGLTHPNIVNVYDVGEDRGLYYIVMELVEGITLKEYISKKERLSSKEAISIAIQVCSGIAEAHKHGIIHRDIKPQNIIISKAGKVKVTDFGIAKATSSNTISTNAMGSVHYTSPEQARGGFSDAKSDIYSLGITLYEMITGELPFDGDSTVTIALKHLQEDITPPSEIVEDIPYSLEQIILKCTQKSTDRRYASVAQLEKDLRRSLTDPDGDFVVIAPLKSLQDTVIVSEDELSQIKNASVREDEDDDDYEAEEENDGYEGYEDKKSDSSKKEIDPKMAKIMKILTIVVAAIFIFVLVFTVGKATGILKIGSGTKQEEMTYIVPGLVGMKEAKAEEACEAVGLQMKVAERVESDKYEKGYVISQKTQEGTKMPEGAYVQVVVSSGLKGEEIEIPDVKNKTEDEAIKTLVSAGFKKANITVTTQTNSEVEAGKVISISPEVGSKATEKAEIVIYISSGAEKTQVPYLVGKTQSQAQSALSAAGLSGSAKEVYSSEAAGKVISQDINSGTEVDKGTTVSYTVSKGEEPTPTATIPTGLAGKSFSSVKATLSNLGLNVTARYEESSTYADGYVIRVEGEGSTVNQGTTVTVVVSTGSAPQTPTTPETGSSDPSDGSESTEGTEQ